MTDNILSNNFENDYDQIITYYGTWEVTKTILNRDQSLNIISLNLRSANENVDKFCIMFDNQTIIFDIIILTEAWLGLHNLNYNQFQIPNYTMYKTTNYINKNNGIISFINNSIINTQVTDLNTNFMSSLEINCKKGNSNFIVYGIYRHPQIDINYFLDEFEQTIPHRARANILYMVIKGDLNIDIINNGTDSNNYLNLINFILVSLTL